MRTRNIEVQRRASRKYVEDHRASGICVRCPSPAVPSRTLCEPCAVLHREYVREHRAHYTERQRQIRAQRKELGLCPPCGSVAVTGQAKCARCLEGDRRRHASQFGNNRPPKIAHLECLFCKLPPSPDRSMCGRHLEMGRKARALFRARRAAGLPKREYFPRGPFIGPIQQRPAKPAIQAIPLRDIAPVCSCGKHPVMRGGSHCFVCAVRMRRDA
jgi:hypothetical protein